MSLREIYNMYCVFFPLPRKSFPKGNKLFTSRIYYFSLKHRILVKYFYLFFCSRLSVFRLIERFFIFFLRKKNKYVQIKENVKHTWLNIHYLCTESTKHQWGVCRLCLEIRLKTFSKNRKSENCVGPRKITKKK